MEDLLIAPVWHGRIQATDLIVISDVQHLSQSWRSTGNNVRDEELSISIVVKRTDIEYRLHLHAHSPEVCSMKQVLHIRGML